MTVEGEADVRFPQILVSRPTDRFWSARMGAHEVDHDHDDHDNSGRAGL